MKVLLVDPFLTGHHLIYAKKIIEFLKQHNVEIYFMTNDSFNEEIENVKVIKIENISDKNKFSKIINQTRYYKEILKYVNKYKIDIVHLLYLDNQTIPLILSLPYLNKIILKSKVCGTIHWYTNIIGYGGLKRKIKISIFNILKDKFHLFFVHGNHNKSMLKEYLKIKDEKIAVIPYGTDPYEGIDKRNCREKLGINEDEKVLLIFGGLRKDKGIDIFIESFKYLQDNNFTVLIAGDNGEYYKLITLLNEYKNIRLINFNRFINDEEIPYMYGSADVLILPYRKIFSGQSGPLTLAAKYGLPVIGTNVGEIGSTIEENDLGIVIEPEDPQMLAQAIREFFRMSREDIDKYGNQLKQYSIKNSWNVMSEKIYSYYFILKNDEKGSQD